MLIRVVVSRTQKQITTAIVLVVVAVVLVASKVAGSSDVDVVSNREEDGGPAPINASHMFLDCSSDFARTGRQVESRYRVPTFCMFSSVSVTGAATFSHDTAEPLPGTLITGLRTLIA